MMCRRTCFFVDSKLFVDRYKTFVLLIYKSLFNLFAFLLLLQVATGCREDELVVPMEYGIVGEGGIQSVKIFANFAH